MRRTRHGRAPAPTATTPSLDRRRCRQDEQHPADPGERPCRGGVAGRGKYCPDAINHARAHHQLFTKPRVGDIFLCHDGHHTGIVSRVFPDGHFDTVEGNAGANTDRVVNGIRGGSGDPQRGTY